MYGAQKNMTVDLGDVLDANENEILEFDAVASAVNFVRIANSATTAAVDISAQGDDTNVGMDVSTKGTGTLTFWSGDGARELLTLLNVASAVDQLQISPAATGGAGPLIESAGDGTNIDIRFLAKGTGAFTFNNGTDPVQIEMLGAAGTYTNEITDVNGNEILALQGVASAVAEITISNAATGANPILGTQGETNSGLDITVAGTGAVRLNNGTDPVVLTFMGAAAGFNNEIQDVNGNEILGLQGVASAVNEFTIVNAATGANPGLAVQGGDTNIGINVTPKGTGEIKLIGPVNRREPVTASGGATRTLLATDSGSMNLFDAATGIAYTLPTPAVGLIYDFVVTVLQTSGTNSIITAATGTEFIRGYITMFSDVDVTPSGTLGPKGFAGNGTSHVKIDTNATTTGGGIGSWIRVLGVSTTVWQAWGILRSPSGTIATPFLVA